MWIHTNICKQTKPLIIIIKWTNVSCEIEDFVETHLCKLCAILRSRVLSSLLRSILPAFRLLFCRSKTSRNVFWLLVEFKANCLLNTRTLPCSTYTIPTHSFGVRMNNPSVLYAADYCTYTPWTIAYFLIMTIGLSISWGCCRSIPIARCNRKVELSIDTYFFHQLVERDFYST